MMDEVDGIVQAWAAVRPDLDPGPMQLLSRVRRLAQLLDDQREEAFAEHGLASHEFDVLAALRRSEESGGLTPGQLTEATHVTSGTMTNRLDRLQRRRLVRRAPDPQDRRQSLVTLTATGRRKVDGAMASLLDIEAALIAGLGPRELATTVRALRTLLAQAASNWAQPESSPEVQPKIVGRPG
jgi:DNA-binding MarR family transcriptional regulator